MANHIGKKAIIIIDKIGGHRFHIGETVKILEDLGTSFFCSNGKKYGSWYVPKRALSISNFNKLKIL